MNKEKGEDNICWISLKEDRKGKKCDIDEKKRYMNKKKAQTVGSIQNFTFRTTGPKLL